MLQLFILSAKVIPIDFNVVCLFSLIITAELDFILFSCAGGMLMAFGRDN